MLATLEQLGSETNVYVRTERHGLLTVRRFGRQAVQRWRLWVAGTLVLSALIALPNALGGYDETPEETSGMLGEWARSGSRGPSSCSNRIILTLLRRGFGEASVQ